MAGRVSLLENRPLPAPGASLEHVPQGCGDTRGCGCASLRRFVGRVDGCGWGPPRVNRAAGARRTNDDGRRTLHRRGVAMERYPQEGFAPAALQERAGKRWLSVGNPRHSRTGTGAALAGGTILRRGSRRRWDASQRSPRHRWRGPVGKRRGSRMAGAPRDLHHSRSLPPAGALGRTAASHRPGGRGFRAGVSGVCFIG